MKLASFTYALLSTIMVAYILVIGKSLIIPFIVALLIWQLLNTTAFGIKKIPGLGCYVPESLCMLLSFIFLGLLGWGIAIIISENVSSVIDAAPRYQEKLLQLINHSSLLSGLQDFSVANHMDNYWTKYLDFKNILLNVYGVFSSLTGNTILILLYIIFLFFEQQVLRDKVAAFFSRESARRVSTKLVRYIVHDTQLYLGLKTLTSLLTAFLSFVIMQWVGLDFPAFWALIIFFLNFIPSVGAIIATGFPALLAIIQFTEWEPFLIITIGISVVQFCVGSFLEPRLMGRSLNLSPLVILIALMIWGSLWGIIGMFLAVPITVTMMIIFSHFEKTRKIAVLLSRNGSLKS